MTWRALAVFDLDGTLLRGPTVCEVIAESLGRLARMNELERFVSVEELRAARAEMATWYRSVSAETLRASLDAARLAPGAQAGLALLRAQQVAVGIASITWSFAVEHFARRLGVEHWQGTVLKESGEIQHVWPADKASWVRELAGRLEVPMEKTAAVGDSVGDYEMLRAAGTQVFVGRELPRDQRGWLHCPQADIEAVARHLLGAWRLAPDGP